MQGKTVTPLLSDNLPRAPRMKIVSLLLLILFAAKPASAQQHDLDSLYVIWQDPAKADSFRANAFNFYILEGFLYSNPDTASILADELIGFCKKKAYPKGQGFGLNLKGIVFGIKGNYPKSLDHFTQSLKSQEQMGNQYAIAQSLINLGIIYKEQGDYPKALDFSTRSLTIAEQLVDQLGVSAALSNLRTIFLLQGNYSKALDYSTRSLKIDEQIGDQSGIAAALGNIGTFKEIKDRTNSPKKFGMVCKK